MGKKDKNKKKGKGAEKTAMKTDKKLAAKQKKLLEKIGEDDINEVIVRLETAQNDLVAVTEEICINPPSPRSSFTFIAHPEKDELILFGGEFFNGQRISVYNDLYFYNIPKNEWKEIRSPGGPTPRSGHQMVASANDGGQLWVFGGEHASPSQLQFYHYKDLWVMNLKTRKWEKVNAPNGPSARSGHRMVASKRKLYIFGGFHDNNQSYNYYNDIHIFSLESYTWLKIYVSGAIVPAPRSGGCIAATTDGTILIWGGYTKTHMKKDVERGVTHTDMFTLVQDKKSDDKYKWVTVKASGYKPPPRSSVGCTVAPNGKAYCFGGVMDIKEDEENVEGSFCDTLLSLDLANPTWRVINIVKPTKVKKTSNDVEMTDCATTENRNTFTSVSSDGVFTITVAGTNTSEVVLPQVPTLFPNRRPPNMPTPRMNAGLCVCKGILYVYGGIYEEDNKQNTYNDFYSLDLHKTDEWKAIILNNTNAHDWIDSNSESDSSNDDNDDDDDDDDDEDESDSEMSTD